MYTMSVILSARNSFKLRKMLYGFGFAIFAYNTITNRPVIDYPSYGADSQDYIFDYQNIYYHCVYNGDDPPPHQEIIQKLEEADKEVVVEYCLVMRQ